MERLYRDATIDRDALAAEKDELKKQLRTVEDEYYPINKMAFEIMIMKNHTYSPDNMDIENTDKSQFFYPLDVDGIDIKSEDMALWAKFLTASMRKYFYYYFISLFYIHI